MKSFQGWCAFEDKHSPVQIAFGKDIVKMHISQFTKYRSELLWFFGVNPNLQQNDRIKNMGNNNMKQQGHDADVEGL
jgi:hypothetical protein